MILKERNGFQLKIQSRVGLKDTYVETSEESNTESLRPHKVY